MRRQRAGSASQLRLYDALFYEELEKPIAERKLALVQLARDDALPVFQAWLDKVDRKPY